MIAFRSGRSLPRDQKTRIITKYVVTMMPSFLCHEVSHFFSASTRIFRALRDSICSFISSTMSRPSFVSWMIFFSVVTIKWILKNPQKRLNFLGVPSTRNGSTQVSTYARGFGGRLHSYDILFETPLSSHRYIDTRISIETLFENARKSRKNTCEIFALNSRLWNND